jgi:hypothetical protein
VIVEQNKIFYNCMMEPYINIEACNLIQVISKIKIKVLSLEINKFAVIQVMCYDNSMNFLCNHVFELRDDYQLWINDEWLINYVVNKYGFTLNMVS